MKSKRKYIILSILSVLVIVYWVIITTLFFKYKTLDSELFIESTVSTYNLKMTGYDLIQSGKDGFFLYDTATKEQVKSNNGILEWYRYSDIDNKLIRINKDL